MKKVRCSGTISEYTVYFAHNKEILNDKLKFQQICIDTMTYMY